MAEHDRAGAAFALVGPDGDDEVPTLALAPPRTRLMAAARVPLHMDAPVDNLSPVDKHRPVDMPPPELFRYVIDHTEPFLISHGTTPIGGLVAPYFTSDQPWMEVTQREAATVGEFAATLLAPAALDPASSGCPVWRCAREWGQPLHGQVFGLSNGAVHAACWDPARFRADVYLTWAATWLEPPPPGADYDDPVILAFGLRGGTVQAVKHELALRRLQCRILHCHSAPVGLNEPLHPGAGLLAAVDQAYGARAMGTRHIAAWISGTFRPQDRGPDRRLLLTERSIGFSQPTGLPSTI